MKYASTVSLCKAAVEGSSSFISAAHHPASRPLISQTQLQGHVCTLVLIAWKDPIGVRIEHVLLHIQLTYLNTFELPTCSAKLQQQDREHEKFPQLTPITYKFGRSASEVYTRLFTCLIHRGQ